jgi:hypothetical protein
MAPQPGFQRTVFVRLTAIVQRMKGVRTEKDGRQARHGGEAQYV